jgi:hypothetical protein
LQRYRQRAAVENAYEIRRHPASLRYSLIAAYCWLRAQEITDDLIEMLIQIITASVRAPSGGSNASCLAL